VGGASPHPRIQRMRERVLGSHRALIWRRVADNGTISEERSEDRGIRSAPPDARAAQQYLCAVSGALAIGTEAPALLAVKQQVGAWSADIAAPGENHRDAQLLLQAVRHISHRRFACGPNAHAHALPNVKVVPASCPIPHQACVVPYPPSGGARMSLERYMAAPNFWAQRPRRALNSG